jgi:predicted RNA polymerase sigma factor
VLHVLYLLFNEGYATSDGPDLGRPDLSTDAIRLTRGVHAAMPDDPEVESLLALMLLNDARRPARTDADGELVPLEHQDRSRWTRELVVEGEALLADARRRGHVGEYQLQAAIAACHDRAATYDDTDWREILSLYGSLEALTPNPMVRLNRAVAAAMVDGPAAGLALLEGLDAELGDHHRLHSVRGHLLERAGDDAAAAEEFRAAAARTTNLRERTYLTTKATSVRRP